MVKRKCPPAPGANFIKEGSSRAQNEPLDKDLVASLTYEKTQLEQQIKQLTDKIKLLENNYDYALRTSCEEKRYLQNKWDELFKLGKKLFSSIDDQMQQHLNTTSPHSVSSILVKILSEYRTALYKQAGKEFELELDPRRPEHKALEPILEKHKAKILWPQYELCPWCGADDNRRNIKPCPICYPLDCDWPMYFRTVGMPHYKFKFYLVNNDTPNTAYYWASGELFFTVHRGSDGFTIKSNQYYFDGAVLLPITMEEYEAI